MKTPKTPQGKLTEHIMAKMPEMPVEQYNRVYSAVLGGLNTADEISIAVVPDNDWAMMAVLTEWPKQKKDQFYKLVRSMFMADR